MKSYKDKLWCVDQENDFRTVIPYEAVDDRVHHPPDSPIMYFFFSLLWGIIVLFLLVYLFNR